MGNVGPACKATGFMTNVECIAEAVDRHCFGGHHIERSDISRKVSPTVGGSDTACFCDRACEPRDAAKHRE